MDEDGVVAARQLTKRFGTVTAVQDLTFSVLPGRVTGFLGPNGAGKTTTLRMLLGLIRPSSGTATICGLPYDQIRHPGRVVGAALEASDFHPGRTALGHLRAYAPTVGVPDSRCENVLGLVGLGAEAGRKVGEYSLGMRQRLALAGALLGDPRVLLLDEPANGLDPEGIVWLRGFLRFLAGQGRTVLISSHLLAEVQRTVDDVVLIGNGRLVHASSMRDLEALAQRRVRLAAPDARGLGDLVNRARWRTEGDPATGAVTVLDETAATVGAAAHRAGLELHELHDVSGGLEAVFLRLTGGPAHQGPAGPANPVGPTHQDPTGPSAGVDGANR